MSDPNQGPSLRLEPNRSKIFHCDEHLDIVSKKLTSFYENAEFCDITLVAGVDNFKIEAHRMVLSASSEYFRAMFRSNLRDANAKEVRLEQWDGETLKTVVDYMYTISIKLRNETVENVLRAADFFQVAVLVDVCCLFMSEQLDECNCLRLLYFSEQHSYEELYDEALSFVCANFERVCAEQEFLELSADQLLQFLLRDDICVASEQSLLQNVLKWIKFDEANRQPSVVMLLRHIRYPLLEAKYIVESKASLCINFECSLILLDWLQYILSPQSRERFPDAITRPRKTCKKMFYLSGWEGNEQCSIQSYDANRTEWTIADWPQPSKRRLFFAAAVMDKKLIIAGGDIQGQTSNDIECLDLQTMKWSSLPVMRLARRWFALCELNGYLYAIGGIDKMWTRLVVKYDFTSRTWSDVPPLSMSLMYVQAVALKGLLYATCSENAFLECYNPLTNKWTRLNSKNDKAAQFGFGAVGGCLYTCGGHYSEGRSKIVERYDPQTGEWTEVAPLSVARSRIAVTSLGGRLIASGGHDGHSYLKIVEEYDPETNTWTSMPPLLTVGDSCAYMLTT